MKKKLVWALIVVVLFAAVAFTGCKGEDGKVYLTVTYDSSRYGCYGGFEEGLGFTEGWEFNKKYEVNPGTWEGYYDLAYYYDYSTYYTPTRYYYYVNTGSSYYSTLGSGYSSAIAEYAYKRYDRLSGPITLQAAEKGGFLKDGEDRNYVLKLTWDIDDVTYSYNGEPMTKRVVTDTADKLVMEFTGAPETITMTINKKPVSKDALKNLSMSKQPETLPADIGAVKIEK